MKYTVIGYYPDNDQPWAVCVQGKDWESAIENSREHVSEGFSVRVCAVLKGDIKCVDNLVITREISNEVEA